MDEGLEGGVAGLEVVDVLLVDAFAAVIGIGIVNAFCAVDGGAGGAAGSISITLSDVSPHVSFLCLCSNKGHVRLWLTGMIM